MFNAQAVPIVEPIAVCEASQILHTCNTAYSQSHTDPRTLTLARPSQRLSSESDDVLTTPLLPDLRIPLRELFRDDDTGLRGDEVQAE